ncbi:hypothetical protein RCG51_10130 [Lactococcus lactis]|uniref:hypothetical protein n=1 Tax=Lactococcus lactis TaxID=1358 RepID=UPI00280BE709|nr:hypothetical protein [Lactococcus lactis]WMM20146.1 hypothetical protein RCG38_01150 [Lactococcus lactis]WMM21948.1 hypothetical protein RCG51_10130 [Lactococcus lactis]
MMKQTRCYGCDKPIEHEWLPEGEFIVCDECSSDTDKLSAEKLDPIGYYNGAHGFLYDEFDKDCYCQGGCSMEAVYTESQVKKLTDKLSVEKLKEQLNSKVKALTEIRANIEEHNQIYDLSTDTALLLEGIDGIAFDALAAIGGDDE